MAKPKGLPKSGGRKKGTPNKQTAAVKDMVLAALDGVGGIAYLKRQAEENPTAFMTLVGKVIPTQVNHADNEGEKLEGFKVILVGKAG